MKKKNKVILIATIITVIVAGGIISGLALKSAPVCTKMGCPSVPENATGRTEIPCNSCQMDTPVFFTGLFNIIKSCSGREVIIFLDQNHIETRYDLSQCRYRISSLELVSEIF